MLSRVAAEKGMPMMARRFDAIDANKVGQVSRDELATARKARHGARPQHKLQFAVRKTRRQTQDVRRGAGVCRLRPLFAPD